MFVFCFQENIIWVLMIVIWFVLVYSGWNDPIMMPQPCPTSHPGDQGGSAWPSANLRGIINRIITNLDSDVFHLNNLLHYWHSASAGKFWLSAAWFYPDQSVGLCFFFCLFFFKCIGQLLVNSNIKGKTNLSFSKNVVFVESGISSVLI